MLREFYNSFRLVNRDEIINQIKNANSDGDAVLAMTKVLTEKMPELVTPLIDERDIYLAWSLKRSKAVNGAKLVVGVVGAGHLNGVVYAMTGDQGKLRFSDLVGGKNKKDRRSTGEKLRDGLLSLGRDLLRDIVIILLVVKACESAFGIHLDLMSLLFGIASIHVP